MHLAGDGAELAGLLAPGGKMGSTMGYGADQNPAATFVMANPSADTLGRLAADAAGGRIRVPVTVTYSLADVSRAFEDFRSGTRGKICIQVG